VSSGADALPRFAGSLTAPLVRQRDNRRPAADRERQIQRLGQPRALAGPDNQSIDHDLDVMFAVTIERRRISQLDDRSVHAGARESLVEQIGE
jgi:hypothetical protein